MAFQQQLMQALALSQSATAPKAQRDQAEKVIEQVLKQPKASEALINIINSSQDSGIRQVSAVLLRKCLFTYLKTFTPQVATVQAWVIRVTLNDPAPPVRRILGDLVAIVASFVMGVHNRPWPELQQTLAQACAHQDPKFRELGFMMFDKICAEFEAPFSTEALIKWSINVLVKGCKDSAELVQVQALRAISNFVRGSDHDLGNRMLPQILGVIIEAAKSGTTSGKIEVATTALQAMEELSNDIFDHFSNMVAPILQVSMGIVVSQAAREFDKLQSYVFALIHGLLARYKTAVRKSNLLGQLIRVCTQCLVADPEFGDEERGGSTHHSAIMVIREITMTISARYCFNPVVAAATQCLKQANPRIVSIGLEMFGILSEGCMESLWRRLPEFLPVVVRASTSQNEMVVRHGLMCLGFWCENMPIQMAKYHNKLIPLAGKYLLSPKDKIQINAIFIFECLSEALPEEEAAKYAGGVLKAVSQLLTGGDEEKQERGLVLLSAIAFASKKSFTPRVGPAMSILFKLIDPSFTKTNLKSKAIDATGQIAASVGPEAFAPHVQKVLQCLTASLKLHQAEPDLVEMVYRCLSNLAIALKERMAPLLPGIVQTLVKECSSKDLIQMQFDKRVNGQTAWDDEAGDGDKSQIERLKIEDAISNRRAAALQALGTLATYTGKHFHPFLKPAINVAMQGIEYPSDKPPRDAITTVTALALAFCDMAGVPKEIPLPPNTPYQIPPQLKTLLVKINREFLEVAQCFDDIECVARAVEGVMELLMRVGSRLYATEPNSKAATLLDAVAVCKEMLDEKAACQGSMAGLERDMEAEESSETSKQVIDIVTDLLTEYAKHFGTYFDRFFRILLPSLDRWANPDRNMGDRSTAIGCMAEVLLGLQGAAPTFAPKVLNRVMQTLGSAECPEDVTRNCLYALGVCVQMSGPQLVTGKHEQLLKQTTQYVKRPAGGDHPALRDNACGCFARIIMHGYGELKGAIGVALPMILNALPLQDDMLENEPVLRLFLFLLKQGDPTIMANKPAVAAKVRLMARDDRIRSLKKPMALVMALGGELGMSPRQGGR